MPNRNNVRGINRAVAFLLAMVWVCAAVAGIVFGYIYSRWVLFVIGFVALWYALLWFRVLSRARLLTWREFATPWRTH